MFDAEETHSKGEGKNGEDKAEKEHTKMAVDVKKGMVPSANHLNWDFVSVLLTWMSRMLTFRVPIATLSILEYERRKSVAIAPSLHFFPRFW